MDLARHQQARSRVPRLSFPLSRRAMGKDAEQVEAHAVRALSVSAGAFSYQALFDAIPAEVLQAATDPLRRDELVAVCMDDRNPDDGVYSAGGLILLDLSDA